ncbi:MAG: phosphotransferase [Actinobacteria bacterium]|nr:phosphotransferase [Actinomycetota bacterium]
MADVAQLLARATDVRPFVSADGKSGAALERVDIDGRSHVVKRVAFRDDWLMQAIGDVDGAAVKAWDGGLFDRLPPCIDHATVAMECRMTDDGPEIVAVMRDMVESLVPEGDGPVTPRQHRQFLDHMAAMHAHFWGWTDDLGLIGLAQRYSLMTPARITVAGNASPDAIVPPLILRGWQALPGRASQMAQTLFALHADPGPLVDAMATSPTTFLHGDWKMANLGTTADGRTVLVDWSFPGAGPATAELAHYLALNRARMPQAKDGAIAAYRTSLERHGVATEPWWRRQLTLSLLGIMCALGWEKALGDEAELRWWEARVAEGAALL